ncbi:MAG: DUF11 domain-containing protein, partial [Anaerolineae bacterium]|nr:DUF11 domain-containing protein [Anaerolineae bacterium]
MKILTAFTYLTSYAKKLNLRISRKFTRGFSRFAIKSVHGMVVFSMLLPNLLVVYDVSAAALKESSFAESWGKTQSGEKGDQTSSQALSLFNFPQRPTTPPKPQFYNSPYDESKVPNDPPNPINPPLDLPGKPENQDIVFIVTSSQGKLGTTHTIDISVVIQNNQSQPVTNLVFTDKLEGSLEFVSASGTLVKYTKTPPTVQANIPSLASGERVTLKYSLKQKSSSPAGNNGQNVLIHQAELSSTDGLVNLTADTQFYEGDSGPVGPGNVSLVNPGNGWAKAGPFSLHFKEGGIKGKALFSAAPTKVAGKGPDFQFTLDLFEAGSPITMENGRPAEQSVQIGKKIEGLFDEPAFLDINFTEIADLGNIPAGKEPFVVVYDEENDIWVKMPILETDYKNNNVLVRAAHFSTWGAGLGDSLPQNGANVLLFDQPYTSLFTGSSRYSIPIWTPPGRAGLSPSVSLSYSSRTVDGVLGDVQAPWVGTGWNMDSIEVVRQISTNENGYGYRNQFTLALNGASHQLIPDLNDPSRYYAKDGAFLYVERHAPIFGNDEGVPNETKEWWEVVTKNGTKYRMGWNVDSEQLTLMYGYSCSMGNPCITPNGPYASLGYAGEGNHRVAMRWRVDHVEDTNGNFMLYTYKEITKPDPLTNIPAFDIDSYMSTISYTGHYDSLGNVDLNPGYMVEFELNNRTGDGKPSEFNVWDHYDTKKLNMIKLYCRVCEGFSTTPVRTYNLKYGILHYILPQRDTLVLTEIKMSGGNFSENGIIIGQENAAKITFTYDNYNNKADDITDPNDKIWQYPRLKTIGNGYGGTLKYTYENDNRGAQYWNNWRVKRVDAYDGVSKDAVGNPISAYTIYAYNTSKVPAEGADPVAYVGYYTNAGGEGKGDLIGYEIVTETV